MIDTKAILVKISSTYKRLRFSTALNAKKDSVIIRIMPLQGNEILASREWPGTISSTVFWDECKEWILKYYR